MNMYDGNNRCHKIDLLFRKFVRIDRVFSRVSYQFHNDTYDDVFGCFTLCVNTVFVQQTIIILSLTCAHTHTLYVLRIHIHYSHM